MDVKKNTLTRHTFRKLLFQEFGIEIGEEESEKIELAESCIEIYNSMEEFYEKTGWDKDNPEHSSQGYLEQNHICRDIQGKIWYFSRIRWEEGLKSLLAEKGTYE